MDNNEFKIDPAFGAIAYIRVSSKDQEKGRSPQFQEQGSKEWASKHRVSVVKTWNVTESAKEEGREAFNEMLAYVKKSPRVRYILIAKVDRMSRNHADMATVENLVRFHDKVVVFFHEGFIFHKHSPLSDYIRLDASGMIGRLYIRDLQEKTRRGLNKKAEDGEWPERANYGYLNDKATKLLVINPERAPWVKRIKMLSIPGIHSLDGIRRILIAEGYPIAKHPLHRNLIERIINNPIYAGYYEWPKGSGTLIKGKHEPIVTWQEHEAAVAGLKRYNRPRYRKWNFTFAGQIRCGMCPEKRSVVFEFKKKVGRIYGHCTGVRKSGLCPNSEYVREEAIEAEIVNILRGAQITAPVAEMILAELQMDTAAEAAQKLTQVTVIKQEIGRLEGRIKKAYVDRMDGVINEDDWRGFNSEWQNEKVRLVEAKARLEATGPSSYLPTVRKVLELSKALERLYFSASSDEKRELVSMTCSNLFLKGKSITFTYRKPFDLLAEGLSHSRWLPD